MKRAEDLPKRLKIAVVMLVALLLVALQQQVIHGFFSVPVKKAVEAAKQLSLNQGTDSTSHVGVVHDNHLSLAVFLAFALLLTLFPVVKGRRVKGPAPFLLSRNSCCIVPKGP
jgi:hypothetical protein